MAPVFVSRLAALVIPGLLVGSIAFAQPRGHAARSVDHANPKGNAGGRATERDAAARTAEREAANAAAYLSGKQALVGLHAPSTEAVARDGSGRPMLALRNVNRGESLVVPVASAQGGFTARDLDRVAHLLRSAGGEEHPIDPRTLALAYTIQTHFGVPELRVVSGYRVPKPMSHSNHGKGRAIDLIVPGVADQDVASFVRELGFVGVGVYPTSQFVHVDVRPRSYFWVDYSGPHMKNREHGILPDLAKRSDEAAAARGQPRIEPFAIATDVDEAAHTAGETSPVSPPDEEEDEE